MEKICIYISIVVIMRILLGYFCPIVILIKPKLQRAFWLEVRFVKSLEFELWTKYGFGAFEISRALSKDFTKRPCFF